MPVGKKMVIVLSVVVVGVSVALLFRADRAALSFWRGGSDDPFDQPVERRVTPDASWVSRDTTSRPARRVPPAATAAITEPRDSGPGGPPEFTRSLSPVGSLLPPIGLVDEEPAAEPAAATQSDGQAFAAAGRTLRHTVVDGDTLSSLAERYLGRAEDYLKIYQLNRDRLSSPELLPIGAVLKIPTRRPEVPGRGPSEMVPVRGRAG